MIYRFKVWFEEEEEVYRVIDIHPASSFLDFHNAILDSIGFKKDMPSAFYVSDDNWRKGKEISLTDPSKLKMSDVKLRDCINDPHQKFVYISDFIEQWTFCIELQNINNDAEGVKYPHVFKTVGKAPKQQEGLSRFKTVDENEFDEIANKLVSKHAPMVDEDFDEDGFGQEGDDDDQEGDEFSDEFSGSADHYDE